MADDNTSILSRLDPRSVGKSVASLISAEETDPDPRGHTRSSTALYSTNVDISRADPRIEDYVQEFNRNPIISTPIINLAYEVFEPGWWIEADSEETVDELTEFCHNIGIEGGMPHQSLTSLGKQAVIQHQVRGTFMGEKVTDEKDRHVAINPLNPSTFEIYTKPGTNMLVPPDYSADPGSGSKLKNTPGGEAAAFVQFDQQFTRWEDRTERRFAREEMLHWPRWPDLGDVFGRSAIEPVYDRSIAMREKLDDNDLAIAMKAWPMVLFQLGSEDHPWTFDQMTDFMGNYTEGELGPGMYQGVPGDVEIEEFAGETADIQEHVDTDIDLIISGMPAPRYSLGAGTLSDGGQIPEAHERQFRKLVRAHRRDFEALMTPYLEEVAESWGYSTDGLELNVGRPDGEVAPEDVQGSIIRYTSDVSDGNNGEGSQEGGPSISPDDVDDGSDGSGDDSGGDGGSDGPDGPSTPGTVEEQSAPEPNDSLDPERLQYDTTELADPEFDAESYLVEGSDVEELSNSRLVATREHERELGSVIADVLIDARDSTLDVLEARYGDELPRGSLVASEFRSSVRSELRKHGLSDEIAETLTDVSERTVDSLQSETHNPTFDRRYTGMTHYSLRDSVQDDLLRDVENLADDMATEIGRQVSDVEWTRHGSDTVRNRVTDVYDDGTLDGRGRLIARMRIQELKNRTKLEQYRQHEGVVGVRVISRCSDESTNLTRELAGCDGRDVPVALFDNEDSICAQLQRGISSNPPQGFDPLTGVPPFHFGDTSEIASVTDEEVDD